MARSRIVSRLVPVPTDNSLPVPAVPSQPRRRPMPSAKERQRMLKVPLQDPRTRRRAKGKSKGKHRKTKPTAKSGDVDFDENAQADPNKPEEQVADQEEDPEAYFVEAHRLLKRVKWSPMACLTGLLVTARLTKTALWRPLHVRVQTLQSSKVTHGNGEDLVALLEYIVRCVDVSIPLHGRRLFCKDSLFSLKKSAM